MHRFVNYLRCVLLSCILIASFSDLSAQQYKVAQVEFNKQLIIAIEADEDSSAAVLIQQNVYKVSGVVTELLDGFVTNSLTENSDDALQKLSCARRIAKIYAEKFHSDYLLKKVVLYTNWAPEQLRIKTEADSLRELSAEDFKEHRLDAALEKVQSALQLYRKIDDREDEARCLNSIGLTYFRKTEFEKAESHLRQSIDINREISLLTGVISNLDNLGAIYKAQYKFEKALQVFNEAMQISEEIGDEQRRAEQWKSIGTIYQANKNMNKAFDYYHKALSFADETNNMELKASTLMNLGSAHADLSDFKKSVKYWEEGADLAVQLKDHQLESGFLSNVSIAYRNLALYDQSLKTLKRAMQLSKETFNRWTEGNTLREMGIIYYYKGLPDSSLFFWNQAIEVFKSIPDMSMVGMVTGHIGVYYKNTGQPFKALNAYKMALQLVRQVNNEREEANILGNISNVYNDILADYPLAEEYLNKALEIKKRLGETSFIGILQGIFGIVKKNQGDYQSSLYRYQQALKIAQESGNRSSEAKLFGNMGAVYSDLGEKEMALQFLTKNLEMLEEIGEVHKKSEVLINLGSVYTDMDNDSLGLDYYRKADKLATEQGHRGFQIDIKLNIGSIYKKQGNFSKARESYETALKIARDISALAEQGQILTLIGNLYLELGQFTDALNCHEQGFSIMQKIMSPEGLWKALFGIGSVLENKDLNDEAFIKYAAAIETIESIRSKLTIESLKESFMTGKIEVYHAIIRLLLNMGRTEEAFDYMERAKARNLLDILSTDRINITEGISTELLDKKKKVEWLLRRVNTLLTEEYSKLAEQSKEQYISVLEDSLKKVRFQHSEVLQEIKLNHPRYAQTVGIIKPLTLKEIQRSVLQDDTFLVSYLVTEDELYVCVVSKQTFQFEIIEVSNKEISSLIDRLLHPFLSMQTGANLEDISFNLKLSQELYSKIFQPIERYLHEKSSLIIIPDGWLHYLPFEAMVTNIEKKRFPRDIVFSRYETAHYLIEKYPISYAHSASVLDPKLRSRNEDIRLTGKLFAIGNPDFGHSNNGFQEKPSALNSSMRKVRNALLNDLPNSQNEVEIISELLKPSVVLVGDAAREGLFKQDVSNYEVVHLSTHAFADEVQPMYSWIAFAQNKDIKEDGFLHAYEVFNLNLNANLVTLSACETGLGKLRQGEGLIGLTRAFMYAGSNSVLVSLWSVEDASTAKFMEYFYDNLRNSKAKSEALRQAKLSMLKTREHKMSYAMPFLWAPFVLVGDWR